MNYVTWLHREALVVIKVGKSTMALQVTFGNGGGADVKDLQDKVHNALYQLLNGDTVEEIPTDSGPSIPATSAPGLFVPVAPVSGTGGGGYVEISYNESANSFLFDVATSWNSVKNVLATSNTAESVSFKDFVQADVHLQGSGNSTVEILNVKRGVVETGGGNDTVKVSLVSNDAGWVNAFDIKTANGNDKITILAGENLQSIGGIVNASAANVGKGILDGSNSSISIDAGADNDFIDLSAVKLKSSLVVGGTGVDQIIASQGADTFVFGLGDMAKTLATDTIIDFEKGDKLKLIGTTVTDWTVSDFMGDTVLTYNGSVSGHTSHVGEKIIVTDIVLSGSDWFFA